jgi:hypothetical protein
MSPPGRAIHRTAVPARLNPGLDETPSAQIHNQAPFLAPHEQPAAWVADPFPVGELKLGAADLVELQLFMPSHGGEVHREVHVLRSGEQTPSPATRQDRGGERPSEYEPRKRSSHGRLRRPIHTTSPHAATTGTSPRQLPHRVQEPLAHGLAAH